LKVNSVGDIDILAILALKADKNTASKLMDYFTSLEGVEKIWGKGLTKASVRMQQGFDMDLRNFTKNHTARRYNILPVPKNIILFYVALLLEKG